MVAHVSCVYPFCSVVNHPAQRGGSAFDRGAGGGRTHKLSEEGGRWDLDLNDVLDGRWLHKKHGFLKMTYPEFGDVYGCFGVFFSEFIGICFGISWDAKGFHGIKPEQKHEDKDILCELNNHHFSFGQFVMLI